MAAILLLMVGCAKDAPTEKEPGKTKQEEAKKLTSNTDVEITGDQLLAACKADKAGTVEKYRLKKLIVDAVIDSEKIFDPGTGSDSILLKSRPKFSFQAHFKGGTFTKIERG